MPKITFVQSDGTSKDVEVDAGANVMRVAIDADIPGIVAECGGAAMCATCHIYVDPENASVFPAVEDIEEEMLECVDSERLPESRLSCQLVLPEGVDALTVRIPESQN